MSRTRPSGSRKVLAGRHWHAGYPCRRGTAARFRFTLGGCLGCGKLRRMDAIDPAAAKLALLTPEERDARTNEFLASEEFIPFVLECFAQAVRVAAAENAALGLTEQRFG